MPRTIAAALSLALLTIPASPTSAARPHYERLLRQGIVALEQGDHGGAAQDLRLACFGLLEEPESLARCLTYLGLAQTGAGDPEGVQETFRRLVDLEERFGAYSAADLPPTVRSSLEAAVQETIPPATLRRSAGFGHLAEPAESPEATPEQPPQETDDGTEKTEATQGPEPRPTEEESPTESSQPPGDTPSEVRPEASAERAEQDEPRLSAEDERTLERARTLLDRAISRGDLEEPLGLATGVADRNPRSSEAQHLVAVIAYRSSLWEQAVRYFRRGGDPGDDQPQLLFYLAVSLYESGARQEAAEALRRSLPQLERTPFVRSYQEKILGESTGGAPDGTP